MRKRLARWLGRQEAEPEVRYVEREVCRITAGEWRAERGHVAMAAGVLNNPNLKLMLDCVANSAPGYDVLPLESSTQARLVAQARQEGYVMAMATLQSLGQERQLVERIESTFEPEPRVVGGGA